MDKELEVRARTIRNKRGMSVEEVTSFIAEWEQARRALSKYRHLDKIVIVPAARE